MPFSYKWSKEKQWEWSFKNVKKYIREYVYPYHPYYRKLFQERGIDPSKINTYSDFCKIPLTTKQLTINDYISFILQPKFPRRPSLYDTEKISKLKLLKYVWEALWLPRYAGILDKNKTLLEKIAHCARKEWFPIHYHASGGTTGNPSPALYTWYDIHKNLPPVLCMVNLSGLPRDARGLNLFPAAPHLAFFAVVIAEILIGGSVFHTCGGAVVPTERQVELCERGKFDYLIAIPSYLTYWLEVAARMKKEGKINNISTIKYAFLGGEPIVPSYRKRLKEQFAEVGADNVKILETYGMTEIKAAFYECDEGSGIHLSPEKYFWEVLDPETKEPVEEGKPGILTFSHIGWRGTVFIRYFTGDLVKGVVWNKCENCGFTSPRILSHSMQRAVKDFTKIKGARVPLLVLQTAVRNSLGVLSFQVVITKENPDDDFSRDKVIVYVAKDEKYSDEDVINSIKKNIKLDCEISPSEIIFEPLEKIEKRLFQRTGLKADWVVDERKIYT